MTDRTLIKHPPVAPSYSHAQDFSVITIGTASPNYSLGRVSSSCTAIQHNGMYYVVDTGVAAFQGFLKAEPDKDGTTQFGYKDIAAILFTHLHQDHSTGFFDLMTHRWMDGGKDVIVAGPPGVDALYRAMQTIWRDDLSYRLLRKVAEGGEPLEEAERGMFSGVTVTELTGPTEFVHEGLDIRTAELTHTMYNLGYRFEAGGRSIVVSGDTSFDHRLTDLSEGADILVVDADSRIPGGKQVVLDWTKLPAERMPRGRYEGDFKVQPHMLLEDIVTVCVAAQPRLVVLTHFRPGPVDLAPIRAAFAAAGFEGTVEAASDGREFNPIHTEKGA